jgi:hypothetical protein
VTGIEITIEERSEPGFLTLEKLSCRNRYDDGSVSRRYRCEVLHRKGYDSVAIIPYWIEPSPRKLMIVVARGIRPAPYLRRRLAVPLEESDTGLYVLEAVAGSLHPGDTGEEGIDRRAAVELQEETGYSAPPEEFERLGAGFLPSHGQSTEKVHLRAVKVESARRGAPTGDGSVGEEDAVICVQEAGELLRLCREGGVQDPKIEIGVRRLCVRIGYLPEVGLWRDEASPDLQKRWGGHRDGSEEGAR